jgi:hypothetical protein
MIFPENRPPLFGIVLDAELQIKTAELPVKYAEIACESAASALTGRARPSM